MKIDGNSLFDGLKALVREAVREELQEALSSQTPKAPKLLFSTEEAAAMMEVPPTWLAQAARENKIPVVRVGHYVRFRVVDLERFIEEAKVKQNQNGQI